MFMTTVQIVIRYFHPNKIKFLKPENIAPDYVILRYDFHPGPPYDQSGASVPEITNLLTRPLSHVKTILKNCLAQEPAENVPDVTANGGTFN